MLDTVIIKRLRVRTTAGGQFVVEQMELGKWVEVSNKYNDSTPAWAKLGKIAFEQSKGQ